MRTFVPDRTCWSLLLISLAIRLRNKPMYDKVRVVIINKDIYKSLARKNGNENPIWSWNDSITEYSIFGSFIHCDFISSKSVLYSFFTETVPKVPDNADNFVICGLVNYNS